MARKSEMDHFERAARRALEDFQDPKRKYKKKSMPSVNHSGIEVIVAVRRKRIAPDEYRGYFVPTLSRLEAIIEAKKRIRAEGYIFGHVRHTIPVEKST